MILQFTPTAQQQFLAAVSHIRRGHPTAARTFKDEVQRRLEVLLDDPELGSKIPEFPDIPYREVCVTPYRVFYKSENGIIWVVAVWHGAELSVEPPRE